MLRRSSVVRIVAAAALVAGCATAPPPRSGGDGSVIAVGVGVNVHTNLINWEYFKPEKVLFLRMGDDRNIAGDDLVESNFSHESFGSSWKIDGVTSYLFDARPGTYAAVAATGTGYESGKSILVLFPENVIRSTIVRVGPGSFEYMGKYILEDGPLFGTLDRSDEIQKHYNALFTSTFKDLNIILRSLLASHVVATPVKTSYNDARHKCEFMKSQMERYGKTQWAGCIRKGLSCCD